MGVFLSGVQRVVLLVGAGCSGSATYRLCALLSDGDLCGSQRVQPINNFAGLQQHPFELFNDPYQVHTELLRICLQEVAVVLDEDTGLSGPLVFGEPGDTGVAGAHPCPHEQLGTLLG